MTGRRDYAFEALAEVTASDPAVARGALNAALRDIKAQSSITDSYLLSAEIHDRAKMYRSLWPDISLTPPALAKHWERVKAETKPKRTYSPPPELPSSRREQNLEAVLELRRKMGWA